MYILASKCYILVPYQDADLYLRSFLQCKSTKLFVFVSQVKNVSVITTKLRVFFFMLMEKQERLSHHSSWRFHITSAVCRGYRRRNHYLYLNDHWNSDLPQQACSGQSLCLSWPRDPLYSAAPATESKSFIPGGVTLNLSHSCSQLTRAALKDVDQWKRRQTCESDLSLYCVSLPSPPFPLWERRWGRVICSGKNTPPLAHTDLFSVISVFLRLTRKKCF